MAHSHGDGFDHGSPTGRAGARYAGRLRVAFVLAAAFLVVEAVTAFLAGSLALLSDAAHLLTDAVGIGMALAAIRLADRAGGDRSRTFGLYRLEILAALANAVFAPVTVNGQGGTNLLDYLLYSSDVYVNLLMGEATDLASISGNRQLE